MLQNFSMRLKQVTNLKDHDANIKSNHAINSQQIQISFLFILQLNNMCTILHNVIQRGNVSAEYHVSWKMHLLERYILFPSYLNSKKQEGEW